MVIKSEFNGHKKFIKIIYKDYIKNFSIFIKILQQVKMKKKKPFVQLGEEEEVYFK